VRLDDDTFGAMNDVAFPVARVLAGIDAAAAAGLTPIKVNMVVKRGVNDDRVIEMAERFRGSGHVLRFIECMDVGTTNGWRMDDVVPAAEIAATITAQWPFESLQPNDPSEVATRYRYRHGAGEVGIIASVTQPFCGACTRARLSADGRLYTCLFAAHGHDLRSVLRDGASDEELATAYARFGPTEPTATQSFGGHTPSRLRRSRCPTSAAERWRVTQRSRLSLERGFSTP
jgi:GTP 3',8-cyclase